MKKPARKATRPSRAKASKPRRGHKTRSPRPKHGEEACFIDTLEANRQIAPEAGPMTPGTTHRYEPDDEGKRRLVRKRYSAI
jgi:hypothetical protein